MNVSRKRKSAVIGILLAILLLCVIASLAVLFSRMKNFSGAELKNVIPLTQSGEKTKVRSINGTSENKFNNLTADHEGDPDFIVYDDKTVWQSETDVEIFKLSYARRVRRRTKASFIA